MNVWQIISFVFTALMSLAVAYMFLYVAIGLFATKKFKKATTQHSYGFLIAGRNEEKVIGQLIDSIRKNNYDQSKLEIFVCADNCSEGDRTAEIARSMGAHVYERHNPTKVSKSYALDFLLKNIAKDFPDYNPDGFFVFDADNLLEKNYIQEMNNAFDSGEEIVTSYRASKNYGDSVWAMGSSIHFIRACRFLHSPRAVLNISTNVQGCGFLVTSKILNPKDGWKYGSLTEDAEFSCDSLIKGHRVSYCDSAVFYDEQPVTWKQTYRQRLRWQKGIYQCFNAFSLSLVFKFFTKFNFAFYDFFAYYSPLPVFSTSWAITNGIIAVIQGIISVLDGAAVGGVLLTLSLSLLKYFAVLYAGFFVYGSLSVLKDWKRIKASTTKKLLSMLAYPLFMICIIPICFIAIFKHVEWKPIERTSTSSIEDLSKTN